jgi:hypothetical protein
MDKKTPEEKSILSNWLLTEDESITLFTHLGGCFVLMILFAILLYWLLEKLMT